MFSNGRTRQGRPAREILRTLQREGFVAALFVHVRPELGQAVSVLHSLMDGFDRAWFS